MVKPKIACYITGGWTECGYMTRFLEKINDKFDYRQRFPKKNIGKKGKSKNFKIDGTTGKYLIELVYKDLEKNKNEIQGFSAIVIEDDLDSRFFSNEYKRDYGKIYEKNNEIRQRIRTILNRENMPVFFLYALPEIEAWFLADWDNTFGMEYKLKLKNLNSYFSTTFKQYLLKAVLTEEFPIKDIEEYGYFDGTYRKLSDEIIHAYVRYSCQKDTIKNNPSYNNMINDLIRENKLKYSKKEEGMNMLSRLSPQKVAQECTHYFGKVYQELHALST